jgi:DNA adenine methylase
VSAVVPISDGSLARLVQAIEDEHQAALGAARSAINHAIRCGELLIQAKADLSHGAWAAWVDAHCTFSHRTATGYMRLARELPLLDNQDRQRVANLSLREALSTLARQSRRQPQTAPATVANGAADGAPVVRAVIEKQAPPSPDEHLLAALTEVIERHNLPPMVVLESLNALYCRIQKEHQLVTPSGASTGETLRAPFPYFGGKSTVASMIWERFGNVANYVEPFAGSLAVLLSRPHPPKIETVNDKDGFIANFWRAVRNAPDEVAKWADWPVNEADLHARHAWLVTEGRKCIQAVLGNPDGFETQVAGWWLWGICQWIGHGWCSGEGPWQWADGAWCALPQNGAGVKHKIPHLSAGRGIWRVRPALNAGMGINRQIPHLNAGVGINGNARPLYDWMGALADRLRNVRVCCGAWKRVCGPTPTVHQGLTAVFLDPPYSASDRADVYSVEDYEVAREARAWAIQRGDDPLMRIAFCGYEGEFGTPWPEGWREVAWKAKGGYGNQSEGTGRANAHRERIWFSPHCLEDRQLDLFGAAP